jgi:hypothetical protein
MWIKLAPESIALIKEHMLRMADQKRTSVWEKSFLNVPHDGDVGEREKTVLVALEAPVDLDAKLSAALEAVVPGLDAMPPDVEAAFLQGQRMALEKFLEMIR